jgi:hypothetical protein
MALAVVTVVLLTGWLPSWVRPESRALAFSPTDGLPLVPWAKIATALQSLVSLAISASSSPAP